MISKIANQFRKPSGIMGKIAANLMIKGNLAPYKTIIKELNIQPDDRLFEIGYGPGIGINLISENYQYSVYQGIDFSELMYSQATAKNIKYIEQNRVKLSFGNFLDTEISVRDFNKIFCLNVVYFWEDLELPFSKIRKMLTENGEFLFFMKKKEDFDKNILAKDGIFNKHQISDVVNTLKTVGFTQIEYYDDRGYYIKAIK